MTTLGTYFVPTDDDCATTLGTTKSNLISTNVYVLHTFMPVHWNYVQNVRGLKYEALLYCGYRKK